MTPGRGRHAVVRRVVAALAVVSAITTAGCGLLRGEDDDPQPRSAGQAEDWRALRSRPDLRPPPVAVDRPPRDPGRRLIFLSPRMENPERDSATQQQGALALDEQGRTVWFRPQQDGERMAEVRVQRYRGEPVLTWWQGSATKLGIGRGVGVIADRSYRVIKTVEAGHGHAVDLHEFFLTSRGTAIVTIYSRTRRDLTSIGGLENAQVTEGVVQEIDIETGRVVFDWHSSDYVDPAEGMPTVPTDPDQSYDYFHINSAEEMPNGDLLVSARNTSAVYRVDRETGEVVWRLGGKRSSFEMGPGTKFGIQHDARWLGDGVVQVFDNGDEAGDGETQRPSSVKRIALDMRRMRATLVRRFDQPDDMWALSQGNAQPLADGGAMVGWGSIGAVSRFDARGRLLFDAHLPATYDSYRAYLADWQATPGRPPAIRAERDSGQVTAAVSWNGSTEVRAWQLLAGPAPGTLRAVGGTTRWDGLEATLIRETEEPFVAVAALDEAGRTLATSPAVRPQTP